MVVAPTLLHKSSMKKKRVKFGLAILGGLAAFLLALLALVFAPTLASAGKGTDIWQEQDGGGHSNQNSAGHFAPPNGNGPSNNPHYADNGAGPCAGTLNSCGPHDDGAPGGEGWHSAGGPGDGQDSDQGNGHSPNNGPGSNPQGGQGNSPLLFTGGYPGGGGGGDNPHGKSKSCTSEKDKSDDSSDKESSDKTCDGDDDSNDDGDNNNNGNNNSGDSGFQQLTVLNDKPGNPGDESSDDTGTPGDTTDNFQNNDSPPGDGDDLPPVDPNCLPFAENCGPHDGNPPNPVLTEEPNQVPEPLTLSLFAVGLAGAVTLRRRQKTVARPD